MLLYADWDVRAREGKEKSWRSWGWESQIRIRKLALASSDRSFSFVKHYLGSEQRDGFAELQENSEEIVTSLKSHLMETLQAIPDLVCSAPCVPSESTWQDAVSAGIKVTFVFL